MAREEQRGDRYVWTVTSETAVYMQIRILLTSRRFPTRIYERGRVEKNRRKKQRDRIVIIQIGSDRPRHDPLVMQPTRVYAGPFLPGDE